MWLCGWVALMQQWWGRRGRRLSHTCDQVESTAVAPLIKSNVEGPIKGLGIKQWATDSSHLNKRRSSKPQRQYRCLWHSQDESCWRCQPPDIFSSRIMSFCMHQVLRERQTGSWTRAHRVKLSRRGILSSITASSLVCPDIFIRGSQYDFFVFYCEKRTAWTLGHFLCLCRTDMSTFMDITIGHWIGIFYKPFQ